MEGWREGRKGGWLSRGKEGKGDGWMEGRKEMRKVRRMKGRRGIIGCWKEGRKDG